MAQLNKAEEITAVWNALAESSRSEDGWMTMPVATGSPCALKVGRHFPGGEEAVLVGFRSLPSPVTEQLPEGRGFSVLEVVFDQEGEGRTWIALQRLTAGSLVMFTMMAADIVSTLDGIAATSDDLLFVAFLARIRAWQNFMQRGKEGVLGFESEVGLYGELVILEALVRAGMPPDLAVKAWVGPCDGIQDFIIGTGAIEVKTTTAAGIFPAWISSLEQLDDSQNSPLFLAAVRICQIDTGASLPEKICEIRHLLQNNSPGVLPEFELRLLQAGYISSLAGRYIRKFEKVAIRIILVDDFVPKLVHGTVPSGIIRAKYEINIETISSRDRSLENTLHSLGAL